MRWPLLIVSMLVLAPAARAEMALVTNVSPPTTYIADGKLMGTTVEIVEEMKRRMGLTAAIEVLPWARAYQMVSTMPNVAAFTCGKTRERVEHGFHFIGPVITRKHALFSIRGSGVTVSGVEDIKARGLVVGGVRGDWREKHFADQGVATDVAVSPENNVEKFLKGRFPLLIASLMELPLLLKQAGVSLEEVELVHVFDEAPSYIMLSKDMPPEEVERWRRTFEEMRQSDFFASTAAKYGKILGSEIGYAPDKGFYAK